MYLENLLDYNQYASVKEDMLKADKEFIMSDLALNTIEEVFERYTEEDVNNILSNRRFSIFMNKVFSKKLYPIWLDYMRNRGMEMKKIITLYDALRVYSKSNDNKKYDKIFRVYNAIARDNDRPGNTITLDFVLSKYSSVEKLKKVRGIGEQSIKFILNVAKFHGYNYKWILDALSEED